MLGVNDMRNYVSYLWAEPTARIRWNVHPRDDDDLRRQEPIVAFTEDNQLSNQLEHFSSLCGNTCLFRRPRIFAEVHHAVGIPQVDVCPERRDNWISRAEVWIERGIRWRVQWHESVDMNLHSTVTEVINLEETKFAVTVPVSGTIHRRLLLV